LFKKGLCDIILFLFLIFIDGTLPFCINVFSLISRNMFDIVIVLPDLNRIDSNEVDIFRYITNSFPIDCSAIISILILI
tara:strand:+ start:97 stop:333 length:237 start_codon:yes stop_codon:yes gene_type:complete